MAVNYLEGDKRIEPAKTESHSGFRERGIPDAIFIAVFNDTFERIRNMILKFTKDPEEAADLAMDTIVSAWENKDRFVRTDDSDEHADIKGWLFRIANNNTINDHRNRSRRKTGPITDTMGAVLKDRRRGPEEAVIVGEERKIVAALTLELIPPQRDTLILRFVADMPYKKIADKVGSTEKGAKQLAVRGRKTIKQRLALLGIKDLGY